MLAIVIKLVIVIISLWYITKCIQCIKANMPKVGSILFKIGYGIYTGTRVGLLYHLREIRQARAKYPAGHSKPKSTVSGSLEVIAVPIIKDNYSYIIRSRHDDSVVLVDPSDADAVVTYIRQNNVPTPSAVLTTHKHWDHAGGNRKIRSRFPHIPVYGGGIDRPWGVTHWARDKEDITVGSIRIIPYHTPGHTTGHTVYRVLNTAADQDLLFTGDLLFYAGIGRIFEGDGNTMLASLDTLLTLDENTLVFPGHEYALDNLEFGASIDPENNALLETLNKIKLLRDQRQPTAPSTLKDEKQYNVFLRTADIEIVKAAGFSESPGIGDPNLRVNVLVKLRTLKDAFKYKL